MTTRWRQIPEGTITPFSDKNESYIALGDTIRYRRKVRAERESTERCTVVTIPGHYEMVETKVVGFGRQVRKHWKRGFESIEYIDVESENDFNAYRIYRTDLVEVV